VTIFFGDKTGLASMHGLQKDVGEAQWSISTYVLTKNFEEIILY